MSRRRQRTYWLLLLLVAPTSAPAGAHPLAFTETTLTLRANGTFEADVIVDLDALALGAPQTTDDAQLVAALEGLSPGELEDTIARLARLFTRRVRVRFDDQPAPFSVTFPDRGTPRATQAEIPTLLGLTARLTGEIPGDAREVEFFASRAFADVHLTVVHELSESTWTEVIERGDRSAPYDLTTPPPPPSAGEIARQYLRLGFVHIVPEGLDHILFVLGLFLLSTKLAPLVAQVTVFTVAHAVTLALGALDLATLPARVVEPLIALSIVWVAVDNLRPRPDDRRRATRLAVVFLFGLLHGLGFAGVLRELGLPTDQRTLGLLAFNLGIELGQLTVIAGAFGLVGWWRRAPWYRPRLVVPASIAIALVGLFWTVERMLGT